MDPVTFADELQRFASGLAQDTLDKMEVYRLENENFKKWTLRLAEMLSVQGSFRDFDAIRSEVTSKVREILAIRRTT